MFKCKRSNLYTLMTFVCVSAIGAYCTYLSIITQQKEQQLLISDTLSAHVSSIELHLSHALSTTYILAQEVRSSNGVLKDFEHFAEEVMKTLSGVYSLQLAPDGIIQAIYPLADNEQGIGHNLLLSDDRKNEALQAIKSKKLTLAGPFKLIQGRMGITGRNPVFLEHNGKQYFWGFAIALIYLDDLLAFAELEKLQQQGYAFQLSRLHPDTGKEDIFSRSDSDLDELQVTKNINIPNGEWSMTISRSSDFTLHILVGMILSLFCASIFTLLIRRISLEPELLRELVRKKISQLEQLAFNDDLTGLANRRSVTEQLDRAILRARREGNNLALMYLDLDDFKNTNDSAGHEGGDKLLIEVAQRLKDTVRETDIVGRLGGDEFVVILTHIKNTESVQLVAEKIINNISKPLHLEQMAVTVGVSVGIVIAPQDGVSSEVLLRNADLAMYKSKQSGKNKVTFYTPEM